MKKALILSLLSLGLTSVVNASETQKNCEMPIDQIESCSLNSDAASVAITVHYPRHLYCQIKLVADVPSLTPELLTKLADHLLVQLDDRYLGKMLQLSPAIKSEEGTIEYELGVNTLYMAEVTISTIYGNSLNSSIKSVFGQDVNLTAVPINCIK